MLVQAKISSTASAMPQARAHKVEQKTNYKLEEVVICVFLIELLIDYVCGYERDARTSVGYLFQLIVHNL